MDAEGFGFSKGFEDGFFHLVFWHCGLLRWGHHKENSGPDPGIPGLGGDRCGFFRGVHPVIHRHTAGAGVERWEIIGLVADYRDALGFEDLTRGR